MKPWHARTELALIAGVCLEQRSNRASAKNVTVQVLNFQSWTFYFGLTCVLGLYSLHRLSFVQEPSGTADRLALRDVFLEARRWSAHSLSSAAGLLRIVRLPEWLTGP